MKITLTKETIESFLIELCDPTCMNPEIVISEDSIYVESDLYDLTGEHIVLGRVEDMQEFFLGDLNNYFYHEATEKQIKKIAAEIHSDYSFIQDCVDETINDLENY